MLGTIVTVHLADVGFRNALRLVRKAPKPGEVRGLRHADIGTAAPLPADALPLGAQP